MAHMVIGTLGRISVLNLEISDTWLKLILVVEFVIDYFPTFTPLLLSSSRVSLGG